MKDKIISKIFWYNRIFEGKQFAIIGNFPQYFDTNCFRTLEYRDQIPEFAGMFQKEAQRICEKKGLKRMEYYQF
jgi:16S rRNA (adenine1518-N6/adenine1519-N6)-dimethyltransferase